MAQLRDRLEAEGRRFGADPDLLARVYRGRRKEVGERCRHHGGGRDDGAVVGLGATLRDVGEQPAEPPRSQIGTYRVTLTDADWRVADFRVAGTYTLRLDEGGALHLSAPPAFDDTFEAGAWTYRISGDIVTIDAFSTFSCPGTVGTYRVERNGAPVALLPIDEPCALRATVFGSRRWHGV